MKNILILCTGNSCRSQIAHGYFKKAFENIANIYSAGIETHGLNINAVNTMKRDGIDISSFTSNPSRSLIVCCLATGRLSFPIETSFVGPALRAAACPKVVGTNDM